jgi:hypothetical protein
MKCFGFFFSSEFFFFSLFLSLSRKAFPSLFGASSRNLAEETSRRNVVPMVAAPTSTTSASCARCFAAALGPSSLFPRSALGSPDPESRANTRHSCVVIWSTPQPPMQARRRSLMRSEERKSEARAKAEEEDEGEEEETVAREVRERPRRPRTSPRRFETAPLATPPAAAPPALLPAKNAKGSSSRASALSAPPTSHAGATSTTSRDHTRGPKSAEAKCSATSV